MATRRSTRVDIGKLTDEELRNPDFVKTKFAELNGTVDARDAEISRHTGAIAALQADIVAVRTDVALKDSLLTQRDRDISLHETRIAELLTANQDLRRQLDDAAKVQPKIRIDSLVNQFRGDIEKINREALAQVNTNAQAMIVDNLEVELKGGIDVSEGVRISQLPDSALSAQSVSTLRFKLKPLTVIRMVDEDS